MMNIIQENPLFDLNNNSTYIYAYLYIYEGVGCALSARPTVTCISANDSALGGTKDETAEDLKRTWRPKVIP